MVYPGLPGQVGPTGAPLPNSKGQQIRQSRAGSFPGGESWTTVLDAMGTNVPDTLAIPAEELTVEQEVAADPHPIEAQNFEAGVGGFDGQGTNTADVGTSADYTGKGGS
jgi:hypothetical protein